MEEVKYVPNQKDQVKEFKENYFQEPYKLNYLDINNQKDLNSDIISFAEKDNINQNINESKRRDKEIDMNKKDYKSVKEENPKIENKTKFIKSNNDILNYNIKNTVINNINNYSYIQNSPINIININQASNLNNIISNDEIKNRINENNFPMKNTIRSLSNINNNTNLVPKYIKYKEQILLLIYNIDIIFSLLKNIKGSIYLQNSLMNLNNQEISILFQTIYPYIGKMMCLEYGNYFIQKLIKILNVQQRLRIYQAIDNNFLNIATNKSGTHSIQTLIETIETPLEHYFLVKLLTKDMLLLFTNVNGYHIIMKIILEKNENQRYNINLFLIANIEKILINPYGAYCAHKFIINNYDLNLRELLIKNIQNNLKNLIFNKNSCSVLLIAIKKFGINNFQFILSEIQNNLSFLSLHPISNSFIIKVIIYLKTNNYNKLISIMWNIFRNDNLIKLIYSHKNGNKLLKKLIEYGNNTQRKYIKAKLNLLKSM